MALPALPFPLPANAFVPIVERVNPLRSFARSLEHVLSPARSYSIRRLGVHSRVLT